MITGQIILELAKDYKYILLRDCYGQKIGYNLGNTKIPRVRAKLELDYPSRFVSWMFCDLNEYINYKIPFIKSSNDEPQGTN